MSAQPPPLLTTAQWTFTLTTETGRRRHWDWSALLAMPTEKFIADLHSAHGWSKLGTQWTGVPVRSVLAGVRTTAEYAHVTTYTDYTTTVPLEDLLEMPTWIAHQYEGRPITVAHGGPARLLIPHLYLFKSAKWVRGISLTDHEQPGTGEPAAHHHGAYHHYGDPWREQRLEKSVTAATPRQPSTTSPQHNVRTIGRTPPRPKNPTKGPLS